MPLSDLPFPILGREIRIQTQSADLTGIVTSFSGGAPFKNAPPDDFYSISLQVGSSEVHFNKLTADTPAWLLDTDTEV